MELATWAAAHFSRTTVAAPSVHRDAGARDQGENTRGIGRISHNETVLLVSAREWAR